MTREMAPRAPSPLELPVFARLAPALAPEMLEIGPCAEALRALAKSLP